MAHIPATYRKKPPHPRRQTRDVLGKSRPNKKDVEKRKFLAHGPKWCLFCWAKYTVNRHTCLSSWTMWGQSHISTAQIPEHLNKMFIILTKSTFLSDAMSTSVPVIFARKVSHIRYPDPICFSHVTASSTHALGIHCDWEMNCDSFKVTEKLTLSWTFVVSA